MTVYYGDYRQTLAHVKADLIFTSPPYNIGSKAPRNDGRRLSGGFDPKSFGAIRDYPDNVPEQEYQQQQAEFLIWCAEHLKSDGIVVYNHKPRRNGKIIHPAEWFLLPAVREQLVLMEEVIWNRGSTHNHCPQMMWQQTERLYVFKKPQAKYWLLNFQHSDVWNIKLNPRDAKSTGHNAPFPLELAKRVIECWSNLNDLICDPYAGSGTTAVAAYQLGRRFEGSEILNKYYVKSCERLQEAV